MSSSSPSPSPPPPFPPPSSLHILSLSSSTYSNDSTTSTGNSIAEARTFEIPIYNDRTHKTVLLEELKLKIGKWKLSLSGEACHPYLTILTSMLLESSSRTLTGPMKLKSSKEITFFSFYVKQGRQERCFMNFVGRRIL